MRIQSDNNLFDLSAFSSGLPLGLYTSYWQRAVNVRGGCLNSGVSTSADCKSNYSPDTDYDVQGLFDVDN